MSSFTTSSISPAHGDGFGRSGSGRTSYAFRHPANIAAAPPANVNAAACVFICFIFLSSVRHQQPNEGTNSHAVRPNSAAMASPASSIVRPGKRSAARRGIRITDAKAGKSWSRRCRVKLKASWGETLRTRRAVRDRTFLVEWCAMLGLNQRPPPCQGDALSLS